MKIRTLDAQTDAAFAISLERFERLFSYPLGEVQRFHVLHGDDYPRFFRAMGRAQCFIAEQDDEIIGSLAVVVRRILLPDRSEKNVGYLGDLKISPSARGGRALFQLAGAAASWIQRSVTAYFGVVMDGTAATPDCYTGRAGLPPFEAVGKVMVVRLPILNVPSDHAQTVVETDPSVAMVCFSDLSIGRYATPYANASERSLLTPVWLMCKDGSACGCLEDTRRAKRLVFADGTEMLTGHLSCFAYRNIESGATLIHAAMSRARQLGYPALFVAIAAADSTKILAELGEHRATLAPATIFASGLTRNIEWNLNTAEI